ncbi:hypothetical protein A6770_26605 [Nostoc minutum NIES-26]|uniref:Uncharacterized protein n=1 Tax=Nostoc minutum NIES-26 TaxID=1844469 RepID=A0A367QQ12_9NOSO|nr:hypothetical protein A6770_26605 [Nostoc minutum NIES-26]
MSQLPNTDPNQSSTPLSGIDQQVNSSTLGNGTQAAQGSENIQNQGDGNSFVRDVHIYYPSKKDSNFSEKLESSLLKQRQEKLVGKKIFPDDHKFDGRLVISEITLYETDNYKKLDVELTIAFGTPEVKIPVNTLLNRTMDIKFGIKNGELYLHLKNVNMPLSQRKPLISQENNWVGTPLGLPNSPIWEFKINNEMMSVNESGILYGFLGNVNLGILELLEENTCCEVEAIFKISINRIYIKIIDLDDGTNKKHKETKIGLLLRYLKDELENYVSKVAIRYDPATIS